MSKKDKKPLGPNTGNDFIDLARRRNARVEPGGNFTKVITPKGSVHITPGRDKLDKWTISNLKRWFKLLGLMSVVFLCVVLPYLQRI